MISIIVTIYKTEKYLRRCLDSILTQAFQDYEVIAVNNASPDRSLVIVEEYMQKHSNIHCVNLHENKGPGGGRNAGLDAAQGEYIVFVDSDDELLPNGLEVLYNSIANNNYDFVCANYDLDYSGKKAYPSLREEILVSNNLNIIKEMITSKISPTPWSKIYKRNVFEKLRFKLEGVDDAPLFYNLLLNSNSVKIISDSVYRYCYNEDSYMHSNEKFYSISLESNISVELFVTECIKKFPQEKKYFYTYLCNMYVIALYSYIVNSIKYGGKILPQCEKELWLYVSRIERRNTLSVEEYGSSEILHKYFKLGQKKFRHIVYMKGYLAHFKESLKRLISTKE